MPPFNFKTLEEKVRSASSLDEAWVVLAEAPQEFVEGEATDIVASLTASAVVSSLSEFDPDGQQNLGAALGWASRIALFSTADQDPETRYGIQMTREKVGDWLRKLPWKLRSRFTPEIVSLAIEALPNENWKQGCWLLSSVGWRDPKAVDALRDGSLVQTTEKSDLLFCTLLDLGVPTSKRAAYLKEAHSRYQIRQSRQNIHSIYALGDISSLKVLEESLPAGNKTEHEKLVWMLLPQTIGQIASRRNTERDGSLAIDTLARIFANHEAELKRNIYLGGSVVSKCNSRKAVRFLLELFAKEMNSESQHDLMLLNRRLEECVGSNQVRALNLSRDGTALRKIFKRVLTKSNDYKGRSLTFEADVKNHLWNLCLTLGTPTADKIGREFIEADQNPYTQFHILADLACLALNPLPSRIIDWASVPSTPPPDNSGTDEIQRMEAIRVVASAGTVEAFNVLLHSQYLTLMGHTLADSADGLAYLTVTLAREDQHRAYVVEELFKILDQGPEGPQPGAVSSSIMDLAYLDLLEVRYFQKIVDYVVAEPGWTENPVVKSRLVAALSSAPASLFDESLILKLEKWADEGDRLLSTSCLETLIKQGLFATRQNLQVRKLTFSKERSLSNLQPRDPDDVNGGIYALLAHREPAKYEADFADFIQSCAFGSLMEAMETLGRLQVNEPSSTSFSEKWAQALVSRAINSNTRYNSESHLFVFLKVYAPGLLASTPWAESFADWTPETREALATALGSLSPDSDPTNQSSRTLLDLQNDTHFGVRRAAFRALGRIGPAFLGSMVASLAQSPSPDGRKLAAEALYWIPAQQRNTSYWKNLTQGLLEDVAEDVRNALSTSKQRNWKITWARKYEEELTGSVPHSNKDVLKRWKYAEAISHVGDDESVTRLSVFLKTNNMPANSQRFLIRTIERLQKNWEKCRQKWPEPFAPGSATTKIGIGRLTINGEDFSINYLVWQRPDIMQPEVLSWGGMASSTENLKISLEGEKLIFTDAEGRKWDIWATSVTPPHIFSFVGGDPA